MDSYYLSSEDQVSGPYTREELHQRAQVPGFSAASSLVRVGEGLWMPYHEMIVKMPGPLSTPQRKFAGVDRVQFFVVFIVWVGICGLTEATKHGFAAVTFMGIFLLPFAISRFRNMGASGWWGLVTLVPLVCLIAFLFCFFQPPGYYTKKMKP